MRANDFLTAIVIPTISDNYEGVFLQKKETFIPLAAIEVQETRLIFNFQQAATPLPMKEVYTKLMLYKTFQLMYSYENTLTPIYGFHQLDNKLIL
ncbi:hypothetical protein BAU15_07205 [Enterococcus sp. JM4C]|uniref:hypothetical protein n=1 Tax=Candidatus Enterococcus huntleyi TaxID=1857217 RepID=UPI001379AFBE|nr:hypothetical protein [Enterococcus sp. JM4C]KAF1297495.1 hypothetical protein BAU15_07205 [Enterococcus sp. JM4C]